MYILHLSTTTTKNTRHEVGECLFESGLHVQHGDVPVRRNDIHDCVWHRAQSNRCLHQHHRLTSLGKQRRQTRPAEEEQWLGNATR